MPTRENCAATKLQFDDPRPFVKLPFEKGLKYWNSINYSILIGHQFLPCDATLSAVYAVVVCLSVCLCGVCV